MINDNDSYEHDDDINNKCMVEMPYAMKLMIQELQTMCINTRIITETKISNRPVFEYLRNNKISFSIDYSKINKSNKIKIYYSFPIFLRPFLLFLYSYIYKLGFMTGLRGFIFYFFQNFLYRFLVDINILKNKARFGKL